MIDAGVIHEAKFSQIVGDIYDCVLEPSRWLGALARIASLTQSASSSVIINDAFDSKGGSIFEHGADQKYLRLYFERYATADLRPAVAQVRGVGELATMEMLCRGEPALAADFFNDFVKPQGFGDLIAIQLLRSGRRIGWLSTARSGIQPRYRERERRVMYLLSPHLCQALALSDAIDLVTLTSYRLEQTVDALSAGVFLTDRGGRIVYMNKSAERQLMTGNALQVINQRLTATDPETNAILARALAAEACKDAACGQTSGALALPDNTGAGYLASVLPLDGGARRELMSPFRASAGVFVQDPTAAPRTAGEAFARLYGLTGAELKVLLALAPGLTAKEAALALGLREPTIKTHLQRIYVKTGMSRQSELVRLLLAHLPPLRQR
jgi:DNA-binding CsgD family transcriptional regulator/PAS domain-containing protein